MNKALFIFAIVLLLGISFASAKLLTPTIIPVDPLEGGKVSGSYTIKIKLEYPPGDEERADVKQVMFRYLKTTNCTQNCKITIGNDLSEAFGWNIVWDTTTVPEGEYDLQFFAFSEGGEILLAQALVKGIVVDQSYQPPQPVEEEPEEEPEVVIPAPVEEKNDTVKETPKTNTTKASEKRPSFWIRFLTWLKELFI